MFVIIVFKVQYNKKSKITFYSILFICALVLIEIIFAEEEMYEYLAFIVSFSGPLSIALPSLYFLHFESALKLESKFNKKELMHSLSPLLYAVLMIPFYFLELSEQVGYIISGSKEWPIVVSPTYHTRLAIFILLFVFYFFLLWKELHNELSQNKIEKIKKTKEFKRLYVGICLSIFSILIVFLTQSTDFVKVVVTIASFTITSLLFYASDKLHEKEQQWWLKEQSEFDFTTSELVQNKKYRSSVTSRYSEEAFVSLVSLLDSGIYRDPTISLSKLAELLNLTNHHLSQVINEQSNNNYYYLINSYRIKDAKKQLSCTNKSIIDIAYSAGFNSKSSFYNEFKMNTNMAPSVYRKLNSN